MAVKRSRSYKLACHDGIHHPNHGLLGHVFVQLERTVVKCPTAPLEPPTMATRQSTMASPRAHRLHLKIQSRGGTAGTILKFACMPDRPMPKVHLTRILQLMTLLSQVIMDVDRTQQVVVACR